MQAINENKLLYHLDRLNGDFRPITADVFLTNFCNNKCPYCTYNRWELDEGSYGVSYEDFVKYTKRLLELGVQGIILTGGGEPTINKDFDRITQFLESMDISYGINTNFNKLRFFKPNYLKVSLDAYDEDSYERNRGVRAYAKVRENIQTYAAWKKENSTKTNLGIQKVVSNPDEIEKFYEANRDLKVDYIVFRPIESTYGSYYDLTDEKVVETIQKSIEKVESLQRIDERVTLNYKWQMLDVKFDRCSAHWSQIAIDERGNVMYCCHKPYEIVGHILDEDILRKHAEAHTNIKKCDVPCRLTAPNMLMNRIKEPSRNKAFI